MRGSWTVGYVCLIAIPPADAVEYLSLLAGIAWMAQNPALLARLRSADTAGGIFEALNRFP